MPASTHALRSDVHVVPNPADEAFPAMLADAGLEQRVRLDARGAEVAALLRRPRTLDDLAQELGADTAVVAGVLDSFARLHVLDTEQARSAVESARAQRRWLGADPGTVPLLIRDDARFGCVLCGGCCGGHNIGPVSETIARGLVPHARRLLERTGSRKGLFAAVPTGEGGHSEILCHTERGSCVLLTGEGRCAVHEELGGERKPDVCRVFPLQLVATPEGIAVSLKMECRGFPEARLGPPLREQEGDLLAALRLARPRPLRPVIPLDDAVMLGYERYAALETALHEAVDGARDPIAALLAMRETIERARGRDEVRTDRVGPDALRAELDALASSLGETMGELRSAFAAGDEPIVVRTEALDQLDAALEALRPDFARVASPHFGAEQLELFRELCHNVLMGKELTAARSLVRGFARFVLLWLCARALMVVRARQVKRRRVSAQDTMDAIVVMHFLLRNRAFLAAMRPHDDALVGLLYDRLPDLAAAAGDIPGTDHRLELHKF